MFCTQIFGALVRFEPWVHHNAVGSLASPVPHPAAVRDRSNNGAGAGFSRAHHVPCVSFGRVLPLYCSRHRFLVPHAHFGRDVHRCVPLDWCRWLDSSVATPILGCHNRPGCRNLVSIVPTKASTVFEPSCRFNTRTVCFLFGIDVYEDGGGGTGGSGDVHMACVERVSDN